LKLGGLREPSNSGFILPSVQIASTEIIMPTSKVKTEFVSKYPIQFTSKASPQNVGTDV